MKNLDAIFTLKELLKLSQELQQDHPEEPLYQDIPNALQGAIRSLETPTMVLMALGCLFAALGLFATVCGMVYVLLGHLSAAHQMAPYAGILAILSVLSCWAVKA